MAVCGCCWICGEKFTCRVEVKGVDVWGHDRTTPARLAKLAHIVCEVADVVGLGPRSGVPGPARQDDRVRGHGALDDDDVFICQDTVVIELFEDRDNDQLGLWQERDHSVFADVAKVGERELTARPAGLAEGLCLLVCPDGGVVPRHAHGHGVQQVDHIHVVDHEGHHRGLYTGALS